MWLQSVENEKEYLMAWQPIEIIEAVAPLSMIVKSMTTEIMDIGEPMPIVSLQSGCGYNLGYEITIGRMLRWIT